MPSLLLAAIFFAGIHLGRMAATPTIVLVEQGWQGGRGKVQTRPRAGLAHRTFIRAMQTMKR